jgi:hypothetical protein
MSSSRRLAAAAMFLLAMSAFSVPACEVDSSTRPRGGYPEAMRHAAPSIEALS